MTLWIFSTATLLSMPKQLAGVYLGTLFNLESNTKSTSSRVIEYVVLIISFLVTILAAMYIYRKMAKARPMVQQRWEAERLPNWTPEASADQSVHHIDPYYGSGTFSPLALPQPSSHSITCSSSYPRTPTASQARGDLLRGGVSTSQHIPLHLLTATHSTSTPIYDMHSNSRPDVPLIRSPTSECAPTTIDVENSLGLTITHQTILSPNTTLMTKTTIVPDKPNTLIPTSSFTG